MTSAELFDELGGVKTVGTEKVTISASEVYNAAHFAQNDILLKLRLIEQTAQLALAKEQDKYVFPPQTPTSIAQAVNGEVVLGIAAHPFHTGDEVVVYKVGTGADGRWIVQRLNANTIQLTGTTTAPGTVGAGAQVFHALQAAILINDNGIRKVSNSSGLLYGTLTKKSRAQFELYREEFGTSVAAESLINFMEEYTEPCRTIHIQGPPGTDTLVKVTFKRRALPSERVSSTVNPFLPAEYDELLLCAIKWQLYMNREEAVFDGLYKKWSSLYVSKLNEIRGVKISERVIYQDEAEGLRW